MGILDRNVRIASVTLALCLLPAGPARAARKAASESNPGVAAVCRRLDAAWAGVQTYQANLKWPNPASTRLEEQGCGLFLFERPGRWLMEFHTPRFEKYVIKGDEGWIYIGRLKQAIHRRLGPQDRAQMGVLVLGQSTAELAKHYNLSTRLLPEDRAGLKAGPPALVLVPKEPGSLAVRRAVLFLDSTSWLPRKLRLQMESGEELLMTLEQPQKNRRLDPSVWNVRFPDSTAVIEQ